MRVLIVVPQSNYPSPPPCLDLLPQGFAYIAGSLKAHGHQVTGVNTSYDLSGKPGSVVLREYLAKAIRESEPDVIATGAMAAEYLFLFDTIAICRELAPDTPIVCGGGIMTNDPTAFERLRPDFSVMDEGEYTIVDLMDALVSGDGYSYVKGLAYWQDEKAIYNPLRSAIKDLDALPFPDFEPANIHDYLAMQNQVDNYFHVRTRTNPRMLPISTGRSCPYKCTFCQYSTVEGSRRKYRGRTMKSVIQEIEHFHDLYQFNLLKIYDDLFSVKEDRIREFCSLLKQTKLDIQWNASMRVCDVNLDLLKDMKSAGCIHIGYGFESASDMVLSSMNKRVTKKEILNAIELTEKAGIGVQGNFIYGDPAETIESINETSEFYHQHCLDHIVHNDYIMPYPGSPIFDHSLSCGAITDKQSYYDTIHLRPRYNMTKLKRKDFINSIEPIMQHKLAGTKFAEKIKLSNANAGDFEHPYFHNKHLLGINATCPHCNENIHYTLPRPKHNMATPEGRFNALPPVVQFCNHCHKRLLISMLPYLDLEDKFTRFTEQLNEFVTAGTAVIVGPIAQTPGYYLFDILEAYGFPLSKLNIHSFLTMKQTMGGTQYNGLSISTISDNCIKRYASLPYVALPTNESDAFKHALIDAGVHTDNILSIDAL